MSAGDKSPEWVGRMLGGPSPAALTEGERRLVKGARTPEALFGRLAASPSLSESGIRREMLMDLVRPALSDHFLDLQSARGVGGFGAFLGQAPCWPQRDPDQWQETGVLSSVDLLDGLKVSDWRVMAQLGAPTCVAHAATACIELMRARATHVFEQMSTRFLDERLRARRSETTGADPSGCGEIPPGERAAKLGEAARILESEGVCSRALWPERDIPAGQAIPLAARQAAAALRCRTAYYEDHPDLAQRRPGLARRIHGELSAGRPVAIALPGFADKALLPVGPSSWERDEVWYNGNLPDPLETDKLVPHSAHVVCVVGFQAAPSGPGGGYFVFRNSWGRFFATAPGDDDDPSGPPRTPWQGYGTVSAAHVDALCWEALSVKLPP